MRKILLLVLVLAGSTLISGCAALPERVIVTGSNIPTGGAPVRGVVSHGDSGPAGFGAYGYVVFTHRPSLKEKSRYQQFCQAYFDAMESVDSELPSKAQMVTFWLVQSEESKEHSDCETYLSDYDYGRARKMVSAVSANGLTGPILLAWTEPFEKASGSPLLLDMSDFATDDFNRALAIWTNRISRDPAVWQRGFALKKVREWLRNFVQRYGEEIVRGAHRKT